MITREFSINAPIEDVFAVISDFESYPEFLPTTKSAKLRKLKSGTFVDFKVDVVKTISYTIKIETHSPDLVSWEFVEGELMKKNSGSWKLTANGNHTDVVYEIEIGFGWMVPKSIVEQVTATQLPEMLSAFSKRAEARSKARLA